MKVYMPFVKSLEEVQDGAQTIYDVTALIPLGPGMQASSQHLDEAVIEGFRMAAASVVCIGKDSADLSWILGEKSVQYRETVKPGTTIKFLLYDLNFTPHTGNGEDCIRCEVSFRGQYLKGRLTAYLPAESHN
jgi:hypothetical protein